MTRSLLTFGPLVWVAAGGCAGATAPLPPQEDTLAFDVPAAQSSSGEAMESESANRKTGGPSKRHRAQASTDVAAVSTGFREAFYWPRRFLRALSEESDSRRDGDLWVWSRTLLDEGWQVRLTERAGASAGARRFELLVSGLRGEQLAVRDFVWMTGLEELVDGSRRGAWTIFDPRSADPGAAAVAVTWSVTASGPELIASNVSTGSRGGDQLRFLSEGDFAWIAVRDARDDKGQPLGGATGKQVEVTWDKHTGAGRTVAANGEERCWESDANHAVDIPCPRGDWPPGSGKAKERDQSDSDDADEHEERGKAGGD